jgi:hypothetical protein
MKTKPKTQKTIAFNVYLNGKLIDTVWFTGYTADEARASLINHDGYDPRIEVRE